LNIYFLQENININAIQILSYYAQISHSVQMKHTPPCCHEITLLNQFICLYTRQYWTLKSQNNILSIPSVNNLNLATDKNITMLQTGKSCVLFKSIYLFILVAI